MEQTKIRLLIVHDILLCGGAERALLDLIRLLDKDIFEITLFVFRPGGEWEQQFRKTGVRILQPEIKTPKTLIGRLVASAFARIRYRFHPDTKENKITGFTKESFDLTVSFKNYLIAEDCHKLSPKAIGYIHGDVRTNTWFCNIQNELDILRKWDRIICVSETGKKSLEALADFGDKVRLAYNPIYAEEVLTQAKAPKPITVIAPYICAVGRLSAEKGMIRLLYLYQRLCDAGVRAKLVIVGDGPEKDAMQYILRGLRCRDSVILTGYDANPYPYMADSLLTVIPSYTEGLPVVAAESLCLGVPIVSAYPSIAETFDGEPCGLITENDDDSLYEGLYRMLTDEELYRTAKAAAERRGAYYRSDALIKAVEAIYQEVCS